MGMNTAAVQRLYVAYFNRPADPVGLAVYEAMLPSDRVATQAELQVIAESYFSPSAEYTTNFAGKSNTQIVDQLYQNIFGRTAEADGLIAWATKLTDGSITVAELALQLSYSAQGTDAAVVDARIDAAVSFTGGLDTSAEINGYSGNAAAAEGRVYLAQISGELPTTTDAISAQKTAAIAGVDASISATVNASTVVAGASFTLTNSSNQTTGGADNFTGTAGNDTFLAVADQALDNGDVIDGGAGVDTLTARYAVDGDTTINTSLTNIETFIIDTDEGATGDHELNVAVAFTGLGEVRIKDAVATDAANTDDINITSIASGVDVAIENGDGAFDVDFAFASTSGTSDSATLNLASADAETVTIAGIETLTINGESGDSDIAVLTTTAATTVNVTGAGGVDVNNIDDATTEIDASASTGDVEIRGIGAVDIEITGGAGNDTFDFAATLDTDDEVAGGGGTDRIVVSGSETTTLAAVTSVEEVEIDTDDIGDATTVTIAGTAIGSATKFIARANTATDNDDATLAFTGLDDGDTIEFVSGGADSSSLADGVAVTTAVATNTTTNTLTLEFDGIGAVTTDTTNDTGLANVEADEIDTLTIVSNTSATGVTTANEIEELDIAEADSLIFSGAADFDANAVVNTTALTSIDSSAMTGDLTLTGLDASTLTLTDGSGDLTVTMSGLTNADTIDGGTGTDTVTGLAVTGLTATTGKLNVSNVDTLIVQATGANTFDLSTLSSVGEFAISGATPGTQTLTSVADGQVIQLGEATGAGVSFENSDEVDITMADATGASDSLTINVENDATGTDAAIDVSGVETISMVVSADTNDATVDMTLAEATTINVSGGAAGALLTLDTLAATTTTVDLSAYSGEVSFSGTNAASSMTVTASSSAADDNFTLSSKNDTVTIGATGAVDVDVDGGGGTDTMNLTVTTGFVDTGEIDNVENLNIIVASGVDITIGAGADEVNGIADATTVTITGGNSLSTFEVGDESAASNDNIDAAVDIDATGFAGNVFLEYAADTLTATTDVDAGALTTDTVFALFDTTATDIVLPFTGVETFIADLNSGDTAAGEQYTFDVDGATGLTEIHVASVDGQNTLLDIDNYHSGITIQLGADISGTEVDYFASSEVDINLASAGGSADEANVHFLNTEDQDGTIDIDAAGVEVLNISLEDNAESHKVNLAGVTATTDENTTINVSGGRSTDGLEITAVDSSVNVIDASALAGTLTVSDRGSSAMTITGGSGNDDLRMESGSDVMTGGAGTDTLTIVQNAVLGGFLVDLTSTTDQVGTYNGSANGAVQVGFESVDLSNITGTFGADITASGSGSTILGTANADVITLESNSTDDDVIRYNTEQLGTAVVANGSVKVDTINNFTVGAGNDQIEISISGIEAISGVTDLVAFGTSTTSIAAGTTMVVDADGDAANDAGGASTALIALVQGVADLDEGTIETALEDSGSNEITFNADMDDNDGFIVAADNGTDTAIYLINIVGAGVNNDQTAAAGELTAVKLITLVGLDAAETLVADNFDFIT